MIQRLKPLAATAMIATSTSALAGTLADFDLTEFDFQIESITGGQVSSNNVLIGATLTGTSNGVGWTIADTTTFLSRTVTNDGFSFNMLPVTTDSFHPGLDFTIQFDQTIDSLIVALSNDNTSDSINFDLAASDTRGSVTFSGTQAVLTNRIGGLALFENINSLTVSHTNTNFDDGFDLAFHAIAASTDVPAPAPLALIGFGLLGLGLRSRGR